MASLCSKYRVLAGSGHYAIYVVYTSWNSFDLTLSYHTKSFVVLILYIQLFNGCGHTTNNEPAPALLPVTHL